MAKRERLVVGKGKLFAAGAALLAIAAGCSSSSHSGAAGSSGSAKSATYTIGLLTDETGPLVSSEGSSPNGMKAGVGMFDAEGYHLKYVMADTGSSPSGALTAAKKLVEQNHVYAVDIQSGVGFGADAFLASRGIPVIGADTDGGNWAKDRNMFSSFGSPNFTNVETTTGSLLKLLGAHDFSAIGYSISPSSSLDAKASAVSAQLAGIKVGYLNTQFPFSSTNVEPAVIAMKNAGVDSFVGAITVTTSLAIVAGMRQAGVPLKIALFAQGYNDFVQDGPATEAEAKGVYLTLPMEPIELHTAATQRLANAMKTYAGIPANEIDLTEYLTYMSVDSFVAGLKEAGGQPSQAQFIDAMLKIRSYNAAGLYGSHTIGFAMDQRGSGTAGADNCVWVVQWDGSSNHLVSGAQPICGTVVPGKTV